MSDFNLLHDLISSTRAREPNQPNQPIVQIRELSDGTSSETSTSRSTSAEPQGKSDKADGGSEGSAPQKPSSVQGSQPGGEDSATDNEKGIRQSDTEDDDQQDFMVDVEEAKLEQLGTLLSAFFQDDRGFNVVDAIVQNSKVQNRIAKALERICERLDR